MKILNEIDLDGLLEVFNFPLSQGHLAPNYLDKCLIYASFLGEKEQEILDGQNEIGIKEVLYSRYYWLSKYIKEYTLQFNEEDGLETQLLKLAEEINQKLGLETDWEMLLKLKANPDLLGN